MNPLNTNQASTTLSTYFSLFFIALIIVLLIILGGCSGYQYITNEQANYEVIKEHNFNKNFSYKTSLEWISINFNSANDVIQLKDEENGKIIVQAIGSYYFDILKTQRIEYRYTLTLTLRDNKIRFQFTTLNIYGSNRQPYEKDLPDIISTYDNIINRLTNYLNTNSNDNF